MLFSTVLASLGLATAASAIMITAPSNSTGWTTTGDQVIEWDAVSTDPSNFTIQLIDPSSPNSPIEVATNVMTSDNSYTYSPPSDLAAAGQYRINLVQERSDGGEQILAQSEYFEVEAGTASSSSASASSASASASSSSSASRSQSMSASGSASSAAVSPSGSGAGNGAGSLAAPGGFLLLLAGAVGILA